MRNLFLVVGVWLVELLPLLDHTGGRPPRHGPLVPDPQDLHSPTDPRPPQDLGGQGHPGQPDEQGDQVAGAALAGQLPLDG